MSPKIRILSIVPYEGMKKMLENIADVRTDFAMDIYVGDLQEGLDILALHNVQDYDVIISRGGTAKKIKEVVQIPVIEIDFSTFDILKAIKLAQIYSNQFAIIGFPSLTTNANSIKALLQYNLDIYTIDSYEDAEKLLEKLNQEGCPLILCDMVTDTLAKQHNMNSILITSGSAALETAINQAIRIGKSCQQYKIKNLFLEKIAHMKQTEMMVFHKSGELLYSILKTMPDETLLPIVQKALPSLISKEKGFAQKKTDGFLVSMNSELIQSAETEYIIIDLSFQELNSRPEAKEGIHYYLREEAARRFLRHFHGIYYAGSPKPILDTKDYEIFNQSKSPILISGETGTGKQQVAAALYTHGKLQNHPYICIDFKLLTEKGLKFLFQHSDSPLYMIDTTICFLHIDSLSEKNFNLLFSTIQNSSLSGRCRLIFINTKEEGHAHSARARLILEQLGCLHIELLPLRKLQTTIPVLASLYISSFDQEYGKEIAGINENALQLLERYDWPYNLTQFKRVLSSLILETQGTYIEMESVARILNAERSHFSPTPEIEENTTSGIDFSKSLAEIEHDIITQVLIRNGNNQSKTASQLGISRSTLWRILKND